MGRYFGTDGVRGVANSELDALLAFKIGAAAAYALTQESAHGRKAKLLIGKDTRVSSDMLENALVAGICSVGADVELLGVIPTPAVAFLTIKHNADAVLSFPQATTPLSTTASRFLQATATSCRTKPRQGLRT
mgnify:CR=1 FL=1